MAKIKKGRVISFFGSMFNLKSWIGFNQLKQSTDYFKDAFNKAVYPQSLGDNHQAKTFAEAAAELNLSEQDLEQIKSGYFRNFLFFLSFGILIAIYSLYHFYNTNWSAGWISMMLMLMLFCASILSHFWYFQIKNKKLSCTFKEWYTNKISD